MQRYTGIFDQIIRRQIRDRFYDPVRGARITRKLIL